MNLNELTSDENLVVVVARVSGACIETWRALWIRFVIEREECLAHKVELGTTVHFSFVVIKSEGSWHYNQEGVDLVVKGPNGEQIQDFRYKISEKSEFPAHHEGVY